VRSASTAWIVAEREGAMLAVLSILIDRENHLAKLERLVVDPSWEQSEQVLREAMPLLRTYLGERAVEVLYTTTRGLTFAQQEMTLKTGFRVLGIFPFGKGGETLKIQGLTAYYFDGVLEKRRRSDFPLHPIVAPFFDICRRECGLPPLVLAPQPEVRGSFEKLPPLEFIYAPGFVAHRFNRLKERRTLSVHFYPFSVPNVLITDPQQRIEIFICMVPEIRFATIIGEHMDARVHPTELYHHVSQMLNHQNISYIEVINDAGDDQGIEAIFNAGYLPTAYFPALKRQGDQRRDYVVMARSFDRLFAIKPTGMAIQRTYLEYLNAYYQLESRKYLDQIQGY
jgi:hypothetical protein